MSVWTHVACTLRLDGGVWWPTKPLDSDGDRLVELDTLDDEARRKWQEWHDRRKRESLELLDKTFGREMSDYYATTLAEWNYAFSHEDEFLPLGSEGTLVRNVWVNPYPDYANTSTVTFCGDLRDYPDDIFSPPQRLIDWFYDGCRRFDTDPDNGGLAWGRIRQASMVADVEGCGSYMCVWPDIKMSFDSRANK